MEQALLEISSREQRQIGQDLHDGLGQHLTGIAFMSKVLAQQLAGGGAAQSEQARKIVRLVNQAIDKTRELARGLLPVLSGADGLMSALRQWAGEVEDLFHVSCRFECAEPIPISDVGVATHLYHIAQEAVNNAIKHGRSESHRALARPGRRGRHPDGRGRRHRAGELGPPAPRARPADHEPSREHDRRDAGGPAAARLGGTVVCCRFPLP